MEDVDALAYRCIHFDAVEMWKRMLETVNMISDGILLPRLIQNNNNNALSLRQTETMNGVQVDPGIQNERIMREIGQGRCAQTG